MTTPLMRTFRARYGYEGELADEPETAVCYVDAIDESHARAFWSGYALYGAEAGYPHTLIDLREVLQADHREVVLHAIVDGEFAAITVRTFAPSDEVAEGAARAWAEACEPTAEVEVAWVRRFECWADADAARVPRSDDEEDDPRQTSRARVVMLDEDEEGQA
jgi:hypothetical protein